MANRKPELDEAITMTETVPVDETLVAEFIRHLQEGAKRQRVTPARFLMVPENRNQLGVVLPESTARSLEVHGLSQVVDVPAIPAPMHFVEQKITQASRWEKVTTGWDIAPGPMAQPVAAAPDNWEVAMETIKIRAPKVTVDRQAPDTERGFREVAPAEVVKYTGLTEVQFEVQLVKGRAYAITEGVLEAIPVILPSVGRAWVLVDDSFVRDPMLLRFNRNKLAQRLGALGDMGEEMVRQVNGLSGQAVHFGIQALAEANIGAYLAAKLQGRLPEQFDSFMKERVRLLYSSARLAMVAYESLVNQAIAWSQAGIQVLSPREFVFAAEATGSFFDGMSQAGEFMAHDTGRLAGVLATLKSDLRSLGWRGE